MTWTLDSSLPTLDSGFDVATLDGWSTGASGGPTFYWMPDYGARKKTTSKLREAAFGDGYTQRVGQGLNTQAREWELTFSVRSETEIEAIEAFLNARSDGRAFSWVPPFANSANDTIRVYHKEYETVATDNGLALSVTFYRVYGE